MLVHRTLEFSSDRPCAVALGCFDGVHLGHRAVIGAAVEIAKQSNAIPAVFTFSLPVRSAFSDEPFIISALDDKLSLIEALGVELCACPYPSAKILSMDAEAFVRHVIIECFHASHVICGYNFSFGKGARGNAALLQELCKTYGVEATVIAETKSRTGSISSSVIREHILKGEMERAAELLCRPFSVSATVIDGQHLARTLGFPTLNVVPESNLLLPRHGVYAVRVTVDGSCHYGIANVGVRPTVDVGIRCVEAHIFDFCHNVYGKTAKIEFLHFLREEKKFDSIDLLQAQVLEDIKRAKSIIARFNNP